MPFARPRQQHLPRRAGFVPPATGYGPSMIDRERPGAEHDGLAELRVVAELLEASWPQP
ncbi:MAG: hypothetical protein JWO76_2246 [Nocardioides sp.]|nr:hypothetical protein [Nocardioides sp.]